MVDETSAFCTSCGVALASGARFCTACGTSVDDQPQTWAPGVCAACGGDGAQLPDHQLYCTTCRWLRPLAPDYTLDLDGFLWSFDAEAMMRLRASTALSTLAERVSAGVGRPWFEAAVNGIRVSERQLPDVFTLAIRAARILGLTHLPEVYVSGENMWGASTFGSERGAFVSLGSVLLNMRGDDLLFIIAREMGHVRAGHALWRTVLELLRGRRGSGALLGGGVLEILNPVKAVQSAIQAPLMAWKRHSEITADRAGLLAVGKLEVAERVLLQWALKSFPLYGRIEQAAWREQQNQSDDATIRLSEWMMTSEPYVARRLGLLREFSESEQLGGWRKIIEYWTRDLPDFDPLAAGTLKPSGGRRADMARLRCAACRKAMHVPRATLEGRAAVNVRCPNPACRKVMTVRARKPPPPGAETLTE